MMEPVLYCLVDPAGNLHLKAGVDSYADVAHAFGLDEQRCEKYRYDLSSRNLAVDVGTAAAERTTRDYLDNAVGTPERLMTFAADGGLPKGVLAKLLSSGEREKYLSACAAIEQQYTDSCGADACLPAGCAVAGEVCLQPIVRRSDEYQKACGAEWVRRFAALGHRIEVWKQ